MLSWIETYRREASSQRAARMVAERNARIAVGNALRAYERMMVEERLLPERRVSVPRVKRRAR